MEGPEINKHKDIQLQFGFVWNLANLAKKTNPQFFTVKNSYKVSRQNNLQLFETIN